MKSDLRPVLALHFCVLLWGFTAVLGKLIDLPTAPLVWWRVTLTAGAVFFLLKKGELRAVSKKDAARLAGIGAIVGLHWLCFYGAVKLANASVSVAAMAATSLFTAFLEPFLMKKKLNRLEVGLGLAILPGMGLIAQQLDFSMMNGFLVGLLGAFLAAFFSILNKKMVARTSPMAITFIEIGAISILLGAVLPFLFLNEPSLKFWPDEKDWPWLLVFALGCTVLPFVISLFALRRISAFSNNLIVNLEPVYGVALAAVFLGENKALSGGFYVGVGIVLAVVFSHPFLKKRFGASE